MTAPHRILLVEDELLLTPVSREALKGKGYEVVSVADPSDLIPAALAFRPDLIVLNFNLPGGNGPGLLEQLRKTQGLEWTAAAFLGVSTEPLSHLDERTWFISKPAETAAFVEAIAYVLGCCGSRENSEERLVA